MDDPTEESLKRLARSLWSFQRWTSVDFPVEERMLRHSYTPADFRDFLEAARAGEASTGQPDTPNLSTRVLSELLEGLDPDTFATLNADARDGLSVLGYPIPDVTGDDDGEYWEFVDNTRDAVERYALRDRLLESPINEVSDQVPTVDVAQAAFQLHAQDEYEFDLSTFTDE